MKLADRIFAVMVTLDEGERTAARRMLGELYAHLSASAPSEAAPTPEQIRAAADVLRSHEHWNMLPLAPETWTVAEKMLRAAARAPGGAE